MSRLYGTVKGARGEATRCGHSGLVTHAAGWKGAIRVEVSAVGEEDHYRVYLQPWHGSGGTTQLLAEGVLDSQAASEPTAEARQQTVLDALEALRVAAEAQP